jgi:hypothetical protein
MNSLASDPDAGVALGVVVDDGHRDVDFPVQDQLG